MDKNEKASIFSTKKKKIFKFFHQYLIYYNFIEIKENYNNDDYAKLFSQQNKSNFATTFSLIIT